jgi:endonuclease I
VWDVLKDTDRDPDNTDNVILIYSGVSVNAAQEYNSGNGWTREHVWAKSRGDFGTSTGPGTDVHALRPLDNTTNSVRNNRSFNNCTDCENVLDKWDNITGSKKDGTNWSFEPRDEVKGDVARMLFYMAVRYEGLDGYVDLEPTETMMPSNDTSPFHGVWSVLMDWHRNDPVDNWEENRNDIIYYSYQNNRNPFIDYPELAEHLWGDKTGIVWHEDLTLSLSNFNKDTVRLFPNPATDIINIKGITTNAQVIIYDSVGRKVLVSNIDEYKNTINVSRLSGMYVVNITSDYKTITKRIVVK